MLEINDSKQTRVSQKSVEEGKLQREIEIVIQLLEKKFSLQEVAEILKLEEKNVIKIAIKIAIKIVN